MPRYELGGKAALITGGAQGIGLATAWAMHARGASVAIVDLEQEAAGDAAARIGAGQTMGLAADVSDRDAIEAAVETVVERFGGLDIVVANAGIAPQPATAHAMDRDEFERVIEVNLLGVWRSVRAALPQIVRRQGHVVIVSSVYAFTHGIGAVEVLASSGAIAAGRCHTPAHRCDGRGLGSTSRSSGFEGFAHLVVAEPQLRPRRSRSRPSLRPVPRLRRLRPPSDSRRSDPGRRVHSTPCRTAALSNPCR